MKPTIFAPCRGIIVECLSLIFHGCGIGDTFIAYAREQGFDEKSHQSFDIFFRSAALSFAVVGARIYRPHGAAMRELVSIQGGQCGNQIGAKFWEVGFYLHDRREVCPIQ